MIRLEDIKKDAQVRGIVPNEIVRIITVDPVSENAVTVYYKDHAGKIAEQMFFGRKGTDGRGLLKTEKYDETDYPK